MTEFERRQAICMVVNQVTEAMRRGEIRRSVWKASLRAAARQRTILALVEKVKRRAEARLPRPTHYSETLH